MAAPANRFKILPARGNYSVLVADVASLADGEICYAVDQDQYYQNEGGTLVAVGATKAQGLLADSAVQPGDNISTLTNDSNYITLAEVPADAVTSVAGKTGDVTLVKADITDFNDADYATAAQGTLADSALQSGDNISELTNDAGYITAAEVPADTVTSVNTQTGVVVLALDDIDDVDLTTVPPNAGEVLGWNGSDWVPTENTGAGSTINSTRYRYENNTDIDSVGAGKVRFDNTNLTLVTEIAFSNVDKNGVDISAILQNMVNEHYSVYFQQEDNAGKAVLYHFTGGCSNVGDAIRSKFPVEYISDSGTALSSGKDCYTVFSAQAEGDSVTSVNGQQGAVVLDADDISDASTTNKYTTAADITKLAGIEDNATADQTGAEIKAAYEAEADTNAFTDAEKTKLSGIADGAEVNLVTSVAGKTGAVTLVKADITDFADGDYATAAQGTLADSATQPGDNISTLNNDAGYITSADGGDAATLDGLDSSSFLRSDTNDSFTGGELTISTAITGGSVITASSAVLQVNGFQRTGSIYLHEGTVPAGTNSIVLSNGSGTLYWDSNEVWHAGNDGSGSGLDADTVDSIQASSFLRSDAADTFTQKITGNVSSNPQEAFDLATNDNYASMRVIQNRNTSGGSADGMYIGYLNGNSGVTRIFGGGATSGGLQVQGSGNNDVKINGNTAWHAGNDGSGSGLDADNLDGYTWTSSGKNLRGTEIYADNWFRNYNTGEGLYNESTGAHFVSDGTGQWTVRSNHTAMTQYFKTNGSTTRGAVHADSNNDIGFLTNSGGWSLKMDSSGNAVATGDVTAYSDITLKENIEVIPNALDKVSEIRGVTYNRTDIEEKPRQAGVIAQEVEAVLPEVVHTNNDGIKSVAYGNLVGLLIEAVKELKAEIETLKAERN